MQSTLKKSFKKWECSGNDLNLMTAAAKLSSRPLINDLTLVMLLLLKRHLKILIISEL